MSETSDQANSPSEACCRAQGTDLKPGNSDSLASSRFFQALSVIEPRTSNNELRTFPPNPVSLTTAFLPLALRLFSDSDFCFAVFALFLRQTSVFKLLTFDARPLTLDYFYRASPWTFDSGLFFPAFDLGP